MSEEIKIDDVPAEAATTTTTAEKKKSKVARRFDTVTVANIHSILKKKANNRLGPDCAKYIADYIVLQSEHWIREANDLRIKDKNKTLLPSHIRRAVLSSLPRCDGELIYKTTMHARAKEAMDTAIANVKPAVSKAESTTITV